MRNYPVIGNCPDGCGKPIYLVMDEYLGFRIQLHPYGKDGEVVIATKIHKDKLDDILLASDIFRNWGVLQEDDHLHRLATETIIKTVMAGVRKYYGVRNDIIFQLSKTERNKP